MNLTIESDKGDIATVDLGTVNDRDLGDLNSNGGNLWLKLDGETIGSLWFHRDALGFIRVTLGEHYESVGDWVPGELIVT